MSYANGVVVCFSFDQKDRYEEFPFDPRIFLIAQEDHSLERVA